jgi:hypothetical protein
MHEGGRKGITHMHGQIRVRRLLDRDIKNVGEKLRNPVARVVRKLLYAKHAEPGIAMFRRNQGMPSPMNVRATVIPAG